MWKNIRRPSLRWPCQGSSKRRMGAVSCRMISLLVRDLFFRWQVVGSPRWSRTKYSSRHEKHSNLRYFFSWQIQPTTRKLCDPRIGDFLLKAEKVRQALLERKKQEFEEEKKKAEADLRRKAGRNSERRLTLTPIRSHRLVRRSRGRSRASPTGDGSEEPEESTNPGDAWSKVESMTL